LSLIHYIFAGSIPRQALSSGETPKLSGTETEPAEAPSIETPQTEEEAPIVPDEERDETIGEPDEIETAVVTGSPGSGSRPGRAARRRRLSSIRYRSRAAYKRYSGTLYLFYRLKVGLNDRIVCATAGPTAHLLKESPMRSRLLASAASMCKGTVIHQIELAPFPGIEPRTWRSQRWWRCFLGAAVVILLLPSTVFAEAPCSPEVISTVREAKDILGQAEDVLVRFMRQHPEAAVSTSNLASLSSAIGGMIADLRWMNAEPKAPCARFSHMNIGFGGAAADSLARSEILKKDVYSTKDLYRAPLPADIARKLQAGNEAARKAVNLLMNTRS
jgi:hypothetical protein